MNPFYNRSFCKILDFTTQELHFLLQLAHHVKNLKRNNTPHAYLPNKSIVLLFQKDSTRTRCSFEVAAHDLGMNTVYLGPTGSQFGVKESVVDSAKVFGRFFAGIEFRGFKQSDVEALAEHAGVPVWNGLTDEWHPTQMIGDFMTIQEKCGFHLKDKKLVFVGDGRNNVARSLMVMSAKLGVHFTALSPVELQVHDEVFMNCQTMAAENGCEVQLTADHKTALKDADVVYTDVWVSMGETNWTDRLNLLHNYQVTSTMMAWAKKEAIFMHCLPAFHNDQTTISASKAAEYASQFPQVADGAFEVTDEVFQSKSSVVFDQAENRMHSIKAIMLATLLNHIPHFAA